MQAYVSMMLSFFSLLLGDEWDDRITHVVVCSSPAVQVAHTTKVGTVPMLPLTTVGRAVQGFFRFTIQVPFFKGGK